MTATGALYHDPGPDFYTRLHPQQAKRRALNQLRAMGYHVTLSRPEAATGQAISASARQSSRQRPVPVILPGAQLHGTGHPRGRIYAG
jgi:hypothetical protein